MKNSFIIIVLILLLSIPSAAVNRDPRFDITELGIGVRSIGMGSAYTALNSPAEAVFGNPATLIMADNIQLHSAMFNLAEDFSYKMFSIAVPGQYFNWGIGVISNLTDGFLATTRDDRVRGGDTFSAGDTAISAGIAKNISLLNMTFQLGANLKYYLQTMYQDQRGAFGGDAGVCTTLFNSDNYRLESGLSVKNIWQPVFQTTEGFGDREIMSSEQAFGAALYLNNPEAIILVDIQNGQLKTGIEIPLDNINLRAGSNMGMLSVGIGLLLDSITDFNGRLQQFEFNYAYQQFAEPLDQTMTHYFGLSYLGPSPEPVDVKKFLPPPPPPPKKPVLIDDSLSIEQPKDKMRTDLDFVWVKGNAGDDIKQVFINRKEMYLSLPDKSFKGAIPLEKFGKNMISCEALDNNGNLLKETRRVFHKASFVDVDPIDKQAEAIYRMAELGFFSGYKDRSFHPEKPLNRAELATLLAKIKNLKLTHPTEPVQDDVPPNFWAAAYIEAVVREDIMEAFPDNTFRSFDPIPHSEAVIIISKFDDLVPPSQILIRSFNDLPLQHRSARWAEIAKKVGILKDVVLLKPDEPLTRGEAALWLYRTEEAKKHLRDLYNWEIGF
ncbi:MAG: S-layer homology domain-containing protein [Candidatus Margulisiibacteriota bacterium]